jgi:hypothetical protein
VLACVPPSSTQQKKDSSPTLFSPQRGRLGPSRESGARPHTVPTTSPSFSASKGDNLVLLCAVLCTPVRSQLSRDRAPVAPGRSSFSGELSGPGGWPDGCCVLVPSKGQSPSMLVTTRNSRAGWPGIPGRLEVLEGQRSLLFRILPITIPGHSYPAKGLAQGSQIRITIATERPRPLLSNLRLTWPYYVELLVWRTVAQVVLNIFLGSAGLYLCDAIFTTYQHTHACHLCPISYLRSGPIEAPYPP